MPTLRIAGCAGASGRFAERNGTALEHQVRIQGGITASILLFVPSPSHGLISLVPWEPTASVANLEAAALNLPRILSAWCLRSGSSKEGADKYGHVLRDAMAENPYIAILHASLSEDQMTVHPLE